MGTITQHSFVKKNFNINNEYVEAMKEIVPSRKQTEFVNRAIKHELEREKEKQHRAASLKDLERLRKFRNNLPKSTQPSEKILRDLRDKTHE